MSSILRKLKAIAPDLPRRRYNIHCGSTTFSECLLAVRLALHPNRENDGKTVAEYEQAFAQLIGVPHAISFGAGRMALYAILEALGIGLGDEVIIPAFTCVVVPNAILYRGAKPVFVDIDPHCFNIDVTRIEAAITPRTRALYAQHTFGLPCDVAAISAIARRHGLLVIEDCALALGSSVEGHMVGSLGDVSFFSTDHTKTINTHTGGIALTRDARLAQRLRRIQEGAPFLNAMIIRRILVTIIAEYLLFSPPLLWIGRSAHILLGKAGVLFYFSDELQLTKPQDYPYPCRLSAALAAIGSRQLAAFRDNVEHRRSLCEWLERAIQWNTERLPDLREAVMLRYSFLVRDRREFERRLGKHFELGTWFTSVVHCRDRGLDAVGYKLGSCPVAEFVTAHIVNLPTHQRVPLSALKRALVPYLDWLEGQILRNATPAGVAGPPNC